MGRWYQILNNIRHSLRRTYILTLNNLLSTGVWPREFTLSSRHWPWTILTQKTVEEEQQEEDKCVGLTTRRLYLIWSRDRRARYPLSQSQPVSVTSQPLHNIHGCSLHTLLSNIGKLPKWSRSRQLNRQNINYCQASRNTGSLIYVETVVYSSWY